MTDKAYIVANEEQEQRVLITLETEGYVWNNLIHSRPTALNHNDYDGFSGFPYLIFLSERWEDRTHVISWGKLDELGKAMILYDGRKENKMKISKKVYDALAEWRDDLNLHATYHEYKYYVDGEDLNGLPMVVTEWWQNITNDIEINNRLITIIRWVNGEDVFEVEKPKKWVVRSKETDKDNEHLYMLRFNTWGIEDVATRYDIDNATKFDTKEEAESWANAHQEVIEVEG